MNIYLIASLYKVYLLYMKKLFSRQALRASKVFNLPISYTKNSFDFHILSTNNSGDRLYILPTATNEISLIANHSNNNLNILLHSFIILLKDQFSVACGMDVVWISIWMPYILILKIYFKTKIKL